MTAATRPTRVGTLAECPRCGGCCYAVMSSRYDGSLYLAWHGGTRQPCRGPSSEVLIDLLLTQHRLRDDGRGSVSTR